MLIQLASYKYIYMFIKLNGKRSLLVGDAPSLLLLDVGLGWNRFDVGSFLKVVVSAISLVDDSRVENGAV